MTFQSTPPARGATRATLLSTPSRTYFNPRPPQGERRQKIVLFRDYQGISIHAPRKGSDTPEPTSEPVSDISIHAPRKGSDRIIFNKSHYFTISIHAPRKGSDVLFSRLCSCRLLFQSTPPARGATHWSSA